MKIILSLFLIISINQLLHSDEIFLLKPESFANHRYNETNDNFEIQESKNYRQFYYRVTLKNNGAVTVYEQTDGNSKWNLVHDEAKHVVDDFFIINGDLKRHLMLSFVNEEFSTLRSYFLSISSTKSYFTKSDGSRFGQSLSAGSVFPQNIPEEYSDKEIDKMSKNQKWAFIYDAWTNSLSRNDIKSIEKYNKSVKNWNELADGVVRHCQNFTTNNYLNTTDLENLEKLVNRMAKQLEDMEEVGSQYSDGGVKQRFRKVYAIYLQMFYNYSGIKNAIKKSDNLKYNQNAAELKDLAKLKARILSDFIDKLTRVYPSRTEKEIKAFEKEWGVKLNNIIN
jgi:hypothetical protein